MRLEGIRIGDIVEVDRLGRRFHALVTGNANDGLSVQPLDRRITYRTCRAQEVVAHWAKRWAPAADERAARAFSATARARYDDPRLARRSAHYLRLSARDWARAAVEVGASAFVAKHSSRGVGGDDSGRMQSSGIGLAEPGPDASYVAEAVARR